jgi:hypothetical protein
MIDAFLVPERTVITANGDSAPLDVTAAGTRTFLLTLSITGVIEQESIDVSIFNSTDGTAWEAKPVATLPQKFYVGEYPLIVDLTESAGANFVRAHWDVNRWGRGANTPHFEIGLRFREIPPEMLHQGKVER